jgi:uncharacterized MAPEG superfamily protein
MATPQQRQEGGLACLLRLAIVKEGASQSKSTKVFDRYQSPGMLSADRAVGNLLEWTPVFLELLWMLVVMEDGGEQKGLMSHRSTIYYAAWAYVGFRFLYVVLALTGAVIPQLVF